MKLNKNEKNVRVLKEEFADDKQKALCNLLWKLNKAESSIQEEGTISADELEEELGDSN